MKEFVYMDASASWLKPQSVIESEADFLCNSYANAGRGICARASHVDELIDNARQKVADFISADKEKVVFTYGTTDGFNRVVNILKNTFPDKTLTVAVSDLDHHSARLPFEMCGFKTVVMPLDKDLNIDVKNLPIADVYVITAMSNVIGVVQDVDVIIKSIHVLNPKAITIVDAAQSVVYNKVDVKKFDCDFLCFSGHKIGSDTGVGVMYIKNPDAWNVDKFGGGMLNRITDKGIILNSVPGKFEAGTLPVTQIVGFPYAIDYLFSWNGSKEIVSYIHDELSKINRIKIFTPKNAHIISFVIDDMHVLDFGVLMGANNICIRVGNMCASWVHKYLGIDGSARISVGPWNTMEDAKYVVDVIKELVK